MTPVTVEVGAIEVVSTSDLFSGLDAPVRSQAIGLDNEVDSMIREQAQSESRFWYKMGQCCAQMEQLLKPLGTYEEWVDKKARQLERSSVHFYKWREISKKLPQDVLDIIQPTALFEMAKASVTDEQRQTAIEAAEQQFAETGKPLNKDKVTAVLTGDYARVKELYESIDGFEEVDGVFRKQRGRPPYLFEAIGKTLVFDTLQQAEESIPVVVEWIAKKLEGRERVKKESRESIEQAKLAPQPWDELVRSQGFLRCENGVDEESILFSDRHCGFGMLTDGLTVYLERQGYYWACKTELVDALEGDYEELIAYGKRVIDDIEEERTGVRPGTSLNNLRSEPGTGFESPGRSKDFFTRSGVTEDGRDRDVANTPAVLWQPGLDMFGIKKYELDPLTNEGSIVPAEERWTLETDKENPTMKRVWRKENGEPYSFVWINHDWSNSQDRVREVLQKIEEDQVENVLWLTKWDNRTNWFQLLLEKAGVVCAVHGYHKFEGWKDAIPVPIAIFPIALSEDYSVQDFYEAYKGVGTILRPFSGEEAW